MPPVGTGDMVGDRWTLREVPRLGNTRGDRRTFQDAAGGGGQCHPWERGTRDGTNGLLGTLEEPVGCPQAWGHQRRHPGVPQEREDVTPASRGQTDTQGLRRATTPSPGLGTSEGTEGHLGTSPSRVTTPRALTALSPQETDQLEEEKAELESEIAELRKEKERLEFVLVAHAPACKVPFEDIGAVGAGPAEVSSPGKAGTVAFLPPAPFQGPQGPFPGCCLPPGVPAGPPNATPAFVFTHPEGATCGASHQRSSSSDQSSDSLNSPSLLAL